jgi:hypothetical protein
VKNTAQPGAINEGKIESRQSALAYNHGMHELDGNVLGIGRIRAAAESKKASAAQKALCHLAAGCRQPRGLSSEETLAQAIALKQPLFHERREFKAGRHHN